MKILIVCFNADLNIPCSQSQWSCSHICPTASSGSTFLFFPVALITKSIMKPAIIPTTNLIASILKIKLAGAASEINIGSISSEVDKNTAINVPIVIILPAYKLAAAAEKPHCGNIPIIPPHKGPNLPDFFTISFVLFPVLCSKYSISKYAKNKKGNNLIESNNVSFITSIISFTYSFLKFSLFFYYFFILAHFVKIINIISEHFLHFKIFIN